MNSFAIDIGGLEPGPAAKIIERIAAHLSIQEMLVAPTTLAVDLVDVATPKRRMGLDADAVQQYNSLLGRGFDLGLRMLMAANAPSEMPLEYARGTVQTIFTRMTGDSVESMAKLIKEPRLVTEADRAQIGIKATAQGDYWFEPMSADCYGPYLVEVPALVTAVGDRYQEGRIVSQATAKFCQKYREEVQKAAEVAEDQAAQAMAESMLKKDRIKQKALKLVSLEHPGRTVRKSRIAAPVETTRPSVMDVRRMLEAADITHRAECRARCVITHAQLTDTELTLADAVSAAKSQEVATAVCFGESLYVAKMLPRGVAAALGYRFVQEAPDEVEKFRIELLQKEGVGNVTQAGRQLRNSPRMPMASETRVKAVIKAWKDHLRMSSLPGAGNDDAKIAKAA